MTRVVIFGSGMMLVALAACNTAPISYLGTAPQPQDETYACALRKINELGYTVQNTNKDAGFIAADKQTSGLGTALLTGRQYHDILTVSIFDDGKGAKTVRATAGTTNQSAFNFGSASNTGQAPSKSGKADAQELLKACANANIHQQAEAVFESRVVAP